jgi:TrpR family transcriptional regulator, trp operon repressor
MSVEQSLVKNSIEELARVLAVSDDPILIEDFLQSILTEAEIDEVAKRWALVKRMHTGESQRSISRELGLSLCKITRGSKELKKENSSFKTMIELLNEINSGKSASI